MSRFPALMLSTALIALTIVPARAAELLMVEQQGCHYCIEWKETLGPIYPKTPEGRYAPLRMVDITATDTVDADLKGRVVFTPTFILIEDGQEIDRLEGYPGEDFFWPLLERMLLRSTDYSAPAATN